MNKTTNISHPLKNRTGSSQGSRSREALSVQYAPIDGKTLGDRLYLIGQYAKLVNYYEVQKNLGGKEYLQADNWTDFFENSLPFQLANLSKTNAEDLKNQFTLLHQSLEENPSAHTLEALLNFIFEKIILPASTLYATVVDAGNSFGTSLLAIIKSSYQEPLVDFIALYNASVTFLCIPKKKFDSFKYAPWQLGVQKIYALDPCIQQVKKGKSAAYLLAGNIASNLIGQFLSGLEEIVQTSPDYLEESLYPLEASLQKNHEPHIALLFTFLELFKHFQGNINDLGKKHLDFFYKNVLKMIPKDAEPDKAHIIFEIAKHLEDGYLLSEDLLLKDGKDSNNQEIQFGLDQELVLDKAQIKELRSLSLYPVKDNNNKKYIEGVYMAPVANSLDGNGEKFKDKHANWATLGDKFSKQILKDTIFPVAHPNARLGFVLASPVLLLQEGKRQITISLDCKIKEGAGFSNHDIINFFANVKSQKVFILTQELVNECLEDGDEKLSEKALDYIHSLLIESGSYLIGDDIKNFLFQVDPVSCVPIFDEKDRRLICQCFFEYTETVIPSFFDISFSGKKGWVIPKPGNILAMDLTVIEVDSINLKLVIQLDDDDPAVVFFDEVVLKENLPLEPPKYPVVKIEIDPKIKEKPGVFDCSQLGDSGNGEIIDKGCCLRKEPTPEENVRISMYHYFRALVLQDANIDVEVCGVKNLIVQNDDNLQDVNKPIMPFGPRPKVGAGWTIDKGANFYIGSKEVFCKNWQKFWINTTWKDKPEDLHEHYRYFRNPPFENGDPAITDQSFRFATSLLYDGIWFKDIVNNTRTVASDLILVKDDTSIYERDYTMDYDPGEFMTLFGSVNADPNTCPKVNIEEDTFIHNIKTEFFKDVNGYEYRAKSMSLGPLEPLTINTRKGFLKLTLAGVSFQHAIFTYVLTRQMMALADLVDPQSIADALKALGNIKILAERADLVITSILNRVVEIEEKANLLRTQIGNSAIVGSVVGRVSNARQQIINAKADLPADPGGAEAHLDLALIDIDNALSILGDLSTSSNSTKVQGRIRKIIELAAQIKDDINKLPSSIIVIPVDPNNIHDFYIENKLDEIGLNTLIKSIISRINLVLNNFDTKTQLGLPKEPYTPLIKALTIDYTAKAEKNDIEIVHLYPFENTSRREDIEGNPTLLPHFDDEGTLFIGLENITIGGQLSILFQLAEATADSEENRAKIEWHYLTHNTWKTLRPDFDVINDATDGLTVSGIVTIAVPEDITKEGNTVMPDKMYWIKVSALTNVKAVAETIGIHTQAIRASARFVALNDKERLAFPLPSGSIAKLVNSDFNVKKVEQLYDSFGGRQPEASGHFYVRVSEHLKHKGRGIMIGDYEKIILEEFPEIYKVKRSEERRVGKECRYRWWT